MVIEKVTVQSVIKMLVPRMHCIGEVIGAFIITKILNNRPTDCLPGGRGLIQVEAKLIAPHSLESWQKDIVQAYC